MRSSIIALVFMIALILFTSVFSTSNANGTGSEDRVPNPARSTLTIPDNFIDVEHDRSVAFSKILNDLTGVCEQVSSYSKGIKPCPNPGRFFDKNGLSMRYWAKYVSPNKIRFKCLQSFELRSGDLEMTCHPNGTWVGEEPNCHLEGLVGKWMMSFMIIFHCLALAMLIFVTDFFLWRNRKYLIRVENRNIEFEIRYHRQQYSKNPGQRRSLYPNSEPVRPVTRERHDIRKLRQSMRKSMMSAAKSHKSKSSAGTETPGSLANSHPISHNQI